MFLAKYIELRSAASDYGNVADSVIFFSLTLKFLSPVRYLLGILLKNIYL